MPIIEYNCQKCGKHFEFFHRAAANDADVTCPDCGAADIKRTVSRFAAFSKTAFGSCPSSHLCKDRDKLHAKYGEPKKKADCDGCPYHHDS